MRNEKENEVPGSGPKGRGRPRRWSDEAEKQRQHRARRRERATLIEAALHAVRNAHFEEPALAAVARDGDDADVLRALIAHYQARHWQRRRGGQGTA